MTNKKDNLKISVDFDAVDDTTVAVANLIEVTFDPKESHSKITVRVTPEQAEALEEVKKAEGEFNAFFWAEKVDWMNNGDVTGSGNRCVRVNGIHYTIVGADTAMRGFGGNRQEIEFNNGETVISGNVWTQGKIPEQLKNVLTDNAKSIGMPKADMEKFNNMFKN